LRVESVAWVTERRDVLSLFWLLPAVICYLRSVETQFEKRRWIYGLWFFWICSLLTKSTGVTLPIIFILLDYYPLRRFSLSASEIPKIRRCVLEKIPFFIVMLIFVGIALKGSIPSAGLEKFPWTIRVVGPFYYWSMYLLKWLFPWPLSPLYGRVFFPTSKIDFVMILHILTILTITLYSIYVIRKRPYIFTVWISYLIMIFPFTGSLQTGFGGADRYTLIPTIPFSLFLGGVIATLLMNDRFKKWRFAGVGGTTLFLTLLLIRTTDQLPVWMNSENLWEEAVHYAPFEPIQLNNYGSAFNEKKQYFQARIFAREAILHAPRYADGWLNYGVIDSVCGYPEDAKKSSKLLYIMIQL